MKILHIIDSLNTGGAENILVQSVNEMIKTSPEYKHFIVTTYAMGDLSGKVDSKCTVICLKLTKRNLIFKIFFLRRFIKQNQIDIIHSHLLDSTLLSRVSAPASVNIVSTYHSPLHDPMQVNYSNWRFWLDNKTYIKSYYLIFVSNSVRENICSKLKVQGRYKIIDNFAAKSFRFRYKYSAKHSLKIISIGNLKEVKNYILSIKALSKLKDYPISLDVYGEGHLYRFLMKEIQENDVKVTLKGKVEVSSELLSRYDLFLMTSLYEGMPLSLIEAMKTGLPSLLPILPALEEVAGNAAIYYAPNNSEELSEKIKSIFNNKHDLQDISISASKKSEIYSIKRYVSSLKEVYNSF